ncbi:MAG: RecX family transcriptional regulator [Acidobacteria bacterium]|nr:RecX family transcriptional regulator [Acidobacteriota bacterium]
MRGPPRSAYQIALRLLARRDYTTVQIRQRLGRCELAPPDIEAAIMRLTRAGLIDDRRVAHAWARRAAEIKLRGQSRIRREIEALGIAPETARQAVATVFAEVDEDGVLDRAIAKRLVGPLTDRAHFRRVYQALVRQGFPPDRVAAQLLRRSGEADAFVEE